MVYAHSVLVIVSLSCSEGAQGRDALRGLTTSLAKEIEIWKMLRINNTLIVQKKIPQKLISSCVANIRWGVHNPVSGVQNNGLIITWIYLLCSVLKDMIENVTVF